MEWCCLTAPLEVGSTGFEVKVLQEWLCLHGYALPVTAIFGSATASALSDYCFDEGLPLTGRVDGALFERLQAPLKSALRSDGDDALVVARKQLANGARDVEAPGSGPWARLYLQGREGESWAEAFVSYCAPSMQGDLSALIASGRERPRLLGVGDVFVTEDFEGGWNCGLVASIHGDVFQSIEVLSGGAGWRVAALSRRLSGVYGRAVR
jgi:hypothetical protein